MKFGVYAKSFVGSDASAGWLTAYKRPSSIHAISDLRYEWMVDLWPWRSLQERNW